MDALSHLQKNLVDESKPYGYTLTVWGSGAVLVNAFGIPDVSQILLYVFGGISGFGLLALLAYSSPFQEVKTPATDHVLVVAMIHLLSVLGTVGIAALLTGVLSSMQAFFIVGVNTTFLYNLLLLAETLLSEEIHRI